MSKLEVRPGEASARSPCAWATAATTASSSSARPFARNTTSTIQIPLSVAVTSSSSQAQPGAIAGSPAARPRRSGSRERLSSAGAERGDHQATALRAGQSPPDQRRCDTPDVRVRVGLAVGAPIVACSCGPGHYTVFTGRPGPSGNHDTSRCASMPKVSETSANLSDPPLNIEMRVEGSRADAEAVARCLSRAGYSPVSVRRGGDVDSRP